jgi:hypothetical protein
VHGPSITPENQEERGVDVNDRWPYPTAMTMQRQTGRGHKVARVDMDSPATAPGSDKKNAAGPGLSPPDEVSLAPSACQTERHPKE